MTSVVETRTGAGTFLESANMRTLLAASGVRNPVTGAPYSEPMLFGLGGGVGFMLFTFEYTGYPPILAIILRYHTKSGGYTGFTDGILARTGAQVTRFSTSSEKTAQTHLLEALKTGRPALCWIDRPGLPFLGLPMDLTGGSPSTLVVTTYDPDRAVVTIEDASAGRAEVTMADLATARAGMRALKNTVITVEPPSTEVDLESAIRGAIRAACDNWFRPEMGNFGLPGLERWASQLKDAHGKRGWPNLFGEGRAHFTTVVRLYDAIEVEGSGGAFRRHYAAFLDEAAATVQIPDLEEIASHYREIADRWTMLARTALPDDGPFGEARALLDRKHMLSAAAGSDPAALAQFRSDWERLEQIAATSPWDRTAALDHFTNLSAIVQDIAEREWSAAERLAQVVM